MGIKHCKPKTSTVGGVEQYINTAYDNIKKVSDNLEALLNLNSTFNNLQGIYLGAYATAPIERPDTSALINGDHYLNTDANLLYVYIDDSWIYHSIFYTQDALNDAVGDGPFNVWIVYADDNNGTGVSLTHHGKKFIGFAAGNVGTVPDTSDASIYRFVRFYGDTGEAGVSPQLHIMYANSADGTTDFSSTTGSYIGEHVSTDTTASTDPADYNWNKITGEKGDAGISVTVVDNGNGTYTFTASNGSVVVSDGLTPEKDVDYFDGNSGDYVSMVYGHVDASDPAPTIDAGTGSYDGTTEVMPTGSTTWEKDPVFIAGRTTYVATNRYMHAYTSDTWSLRYNDWSVPAPFIQNPESPPQSQVKGFTFKRSSDTNFSEVPTGGTFDNPDPTTIGWEDGIPTGTAPIWVSTATFTSDGLSPQNVGNPVVWGEPRLLSENGEGIRLKFGPTETGPWSLTPSINDEYMITSTRDSSGIWIDDTANPVRIKGESGVAPQAKLRAFAFKRSADPAFSETPTGGTYTSPNPIDNIVTGWSDGIPAGTDRLYVSVRTFTDDGLPPQNTSWSLSQVFSYNGTGFRILFSVDGISDWHEEPTEFDEWAQPQVSTDGGNTWINSGIAYRFKGEKGDPGETILQVSIFQRGTSLPSKPLDGSFNFDTRTLTPPAGWESTVPDGIDNVYICAAWINNSLGQQLNTILWEDPALLTSPGEAGADGPRGSRHFYGTSAAGVWSDVEADTVIANAGEVKTGWDVVTMSNPAFGFSESRYWNLDEDPDEWTKITEVIDGNLVVFGTIGADQIAANGIKAGNIDADAITGRHLNINTDGTESGNISGVSMTLDPYSASPMTITDNSTGDNVFSIQLVDGQALATVNGVAGNEFITNISALTQDVIYALNPYYLGAGSSDSATVPATLSSAQSSTITLTNEEDVNVNIDFNVSTSGDYLGVNQNWTAPSWRVEVKRGGSLGTVLYSKVHTGNVWNTPEDTLGLFFGGYTLSIADGLVDTNPGVNQNYTLVVTRISGTATQVTLDAFNGNVPSFTKNELDTNSTGGYSWVDKDTGYTRKSGTISVPGNSSATVVFTDSFTTIYSANATALTPDTGSDNGANLWNVSNNELTIYNPEGTDRVCHWQADGHTA